ncbi:MAG: TIGR00266 family protein [Bacillota bacterium]|nr:TIGR00266 family protein [Bacillota bacterium]
MKYEILYPGSFAMLQFDLEKGEKVKAEYGAMVAMNGNLDVEGKLEGGLMGGVMRALAGEKFFFQTLKAMRGPGQVLVSPASLGDILDVELDGDYQLVVQKDGFLAATDDIEISAKAQNLMQGVFSGEGFFVLKVSGKGVVFLNALGAIHAINLEEGQEFLVDNYHLVAWPSFMHYSIEKASRGWISSFTSGEGLVCRFRGPGTVLIQSRNPGGFGSWIRKFVPSSS